MKSHPIALACIAATLVAIPALAKSRSFNEVKAAVEYNPQTAPIERKSVGPVAVLGTYAWTKPLHILGFAKEELLRLADYGTFAYRIATTLMTNAESRDDFLPAEAVTKFIHPMGVCATASWKINQTARLPNGKEVTGLFAASDRAVPAIVRISLARDGAKYKPKSLRSFGLGLKLFPGEDSREPVVSRNVLFFDQYGLIGSDRPDALDSGTSDEAVQFINFINSKSVGGPISPGHLIAELFGFFDIHQDYRPLGALAEIDAQNRRPQDLPETPTFLILKPRTPGGRISLDQAHRLLTGVDFRTLLMGRKGIVFDIYLAGDARDAHALGRQFSKTLTEQALSLHARLNHPEERGAPASVGTLSLDPPVISADCDQRLHFPHDPN